MRFREEKRTPITLDITPLVDVVFLLLIFFMLTTTFTNTDEIKLNLPQAQTGASNEKTETQITVNIDPHGIYTIQGKTVSGQNLTNALTAAMNGNQNTVLAVRADQKTAHGAVVRVMDAARLLGLTKMVIATQPVTP